MGKAQREAPRAGRRGTRAWGNRLACSDALARPRRHAWDNGAVRQSGVAPLQHNGRRRRAPVRRGRLPVHEGKPHRGGTELPGLQSGRPRGTLRLQCGCNRGRPPARGSSRCEGDPRCGTPAGKGRACGLHRSVRLPVLPADARDGALVGADHRRPRLPRCHGEGGGEPLQTRTRARDGRTGRRQGVLGTPLARRARCPCRRGCVRYRYAASASIRLLR